MVQNYRFLLFMELKWYQNSVQLSNTKITVDLIIVARARDNPFKYPLLGLESEVN